MVAGLLPSDIMGRPPNFLASQWFQLYSDDERRRNEHALCAKPENRLLPWTGEPPIHEREINAMTQICHQCPVQRECASIALGSNRGRGVDGGFYAGVWLPWVTRNSVISVKVERTRKREVLRRLVEEWEGEQRVSAAYDRRA